jgi:aspartate aminotransferase
VRLAARAAALRPSLTLELKRLAAARARRGLPVYDFGLGETKGELSPAIAEAGARAFREGQTQYGDPAGVRELRDAAVRWLDLGQHYSAEHVVVTVGAKQSLFNVFLAACNPGDVVLVEPAPWVSYLPMIAAAGATPVVVEPAAGAAGYFKVTPADLRRALAAHPTARAFLLNSPVNPTGQVYSAADVAGLLEACVEHEVYFVLDRLYWRIMFDGAAYPEPVVDAATRPWLIQVDGISKNFRRTGGIRIGWTVAPADMARAMTTLQSHYTSGPAIPAQHAALAAITAPYDAELCHDLERKRNLLRQAAGRIPRLTVWPTAGAFYSFWDVRALFGATTREGRAIASSDDVATWLLDSAGVVTAPGTAFQRDGYLRLSFATPDDHIVDGCRAMMEAVASLR